MSDVDASQITPKSKRSKKPSSLRIGNRYRSSRLNGPYDAIVIGSGIGGMTTAVGLSQFGKKVLVLEQHYTAGGFTHAYSREGYEWDVGIHYIGDVGYPTMTRKLFDFISADKLKWAAMDNAYDRIFLGEESFDLVTGSKAFTQELLQHFPDEADAIKSYLALVKKVNKSVRWYSLGKLLNSWQQKLFGPLLNKLFPPEFNRTTYEVLKELTDNEKLIAVLTGQWGDSGVSPKQGSFIIHCLIAKHYLNGGFYPVGGASRLAETIIPQIQATGGDVFTYAEVKEIIVKNDKAIGVKMADGTDIMAPLVISNAGVFNTYQKLLPADTTTKFGYDQKLNTVNRSCTNVGLFIGLKQTAEELGLPKTNFWLYLDEKHDENIQAFFDDHTSPMPVIYISFPSAKDPSFNERYPGRSTIEIVAPASYESFKKWKNTTWGKRGGDYEEFSDYFAEKMLEALYNKLPQLRGKIDYYEAATPLSTEFFCYYDEGEIYGLEHSPTRFEQQWLQPKSQISGLYLTGHDVLSCGVAGAMMAGLLTAVKILGWRKGYALAKMIFKEKPEPKEGWVTG